MQSGYGVSVARNSGVSVTCGGKVNVFGNAVIGAEEPGGFNEHAAKRVVQNSNAKRIVRCFLFLFIMHNC